MGIRADPVDGGVVGKVASGEGGVESWDFGTDVCYIVEKRADIVSQPQYRFMEEEKTY